MKVYNFPKKTKQKPDEIFQINWKCFATRDKKADWQTKPFFGPMQPHLTGLIFLPKVSCTNSDKTEEAKLLFI